MGNIVLLDDLTINKIAAGEVIERPASVIKEMVENSIDAGATNISIEIRNGGISYIRVTDNGKGIAKDDMEMAFERHATSKIREAGDLENVRSMGFRGEALASIAAVANVEMASKTRDSQIGNRIVVEAGKTLENEETGCPVGTSITVTNLFFNTPVRYKFLKKDYTESGYIEDAITHLALVHPEISFRFINTGKTIIQTNGSGDMNSVIYAIYGKDIAEGVLPLHYEYEGITIKGVVGKPEIARSNRSNQIFFVNKRYVKDKTLSAGTEKGFKGLLPIGKYGFVIMNVEVAPNKVDVNVHPAKLEVRFEEEGNVFKAVYHAVKDTLLKAELVANTEKPSEREITNIEKTVESTPIADFSTMVATPDREKSRFGGLFRKRGKELEDEEEKENVLAQIYQNNNGLTQEVKVPEEKVEIEDKEIDKQEEKRPNTRNAQVTDSTIVIGAKKFNTMEVPSYDYDASGLDKTMVIQKDEIAKLAENDEDRPIYNTEVETPKEEQVGAMAQILEMQRKLKEEIELAEKQDKKEIESFDKTMKLDVKEMLHKIDHMDANNQNDVVGFEEMYVKTFGKLPASTEEQKKEEEKKFSAYELIKDNNVSVFETDKGIATRPNYKFIGIVFTTYIIIEMDNEMYIIDQHAAHERIMYEKVKKNYYNDKTKDSQLMLLPDIITLTHKEMDIAKENMEMFEKAGFMLEEFGENTIKLTGAPDMCIDLDTKELFMETLDEINTVARTAKQEKEERFIATVACKAAVKAHMALTKAEVDSLMEELLVLPNPFTCPHGRPTAIKMSRTDIEKKFARRK